MYPSHKEMFPISYQSWRNARRSYKHRKIHTEVIDTEEMHTEVIDTEETLIEGINTYGNSFRSY